MRSIRTLVVSCAGLVALVAAASSCGDDASSSAATEDGAGQVVASTPIWADVTSNVLCGEVEVTSIVPAGSDAHSFEASVQDADLLNGAQLVVVNGLGLEEGLQGSIDAASESGAVVLELAPELDPLEPEDEHAEDEHGHDEEHDHAVDPHVWMDPERVAAAVPLIADALAEVDGLPIDAERIQECADDYVAELDVLSAEMTAVLADVPAERRVLVSNHEALGYFADRFDFEVVGAVIPSTSSLGESNARDLDELAQVIEATGVTTIFAETTGSSDVAAALAERVGSQVDVVELYTESPGAEGSDAATYLGMMRANAEAIAAGSGR